MKTSQSFRVHFVVRAYKAKNGKAPLYAAVTVNKEKCLIGLKESVPIEMWDVDKGYPKGTRDQVKKLTTFLEEVRLKLGNCYKELQLKGKFIDTRSIKSVFLGEKEEAFTLSSLMNYHNETATSD